jgi:hypothetical protein
MNEEGNLIRAIILCVAELDHSRIDRKPGWCPPRFPIRNVYSQYQCTVSGALLDNACENFLQDLMSKLKEATYIALYVCAALTTRKYLIYRGY